MDIYTVKQGDSLYSIANQYGISYDNLAAANEIDIGTALVIGQSLVIPTYGHFYTVQSGDSLYSISKRFNISAAELARMNNINLYQPIPVGLKLYIPETQKRDLEVLAYVEPIGDTVPKRLVEATKKHVENLTYLAIMSYDVDRDGNLKAPSLTPLPAIAKENNTMLTLVVTNIEDGAFSKGLAQAILTNNSIQEKLISNIIQTATKNGFGNVLFDIEFIPPENRENYNAFLRKATEELHQEGLLVSTALAPKTSATQEGIWYEAHDYKAHGEIVDIVVLMTYEWGYSGGPARAVSPINEVRKVVEYALTEIPSNKIMLGQNLYGYDWTLPYEPGGEYAKAISPQQAIQLARTFNQAISFDQKAQAPYFNYFDNQEKEHEVWFEDARSIQAKFDLINEKKLRGISYWKLGLAFPQNWLLLADQFEIIKKPEE